jgi:structural maintenance of chromosome 2
MHIKEIIIDGFKSYCTKTSVGNLDRFFNAITGLNGSGKSNILDAICFVLGISSLSHVRASNLQELVYKYGNSGISKASVSLIFDNTDKRYSPIGCEEYDQVVITRSIAQGKSKYYLNGYTVTQDNIKSLFHSVQLNINNPHFLIMQGKVTQVVNMKPLEILGLLEEAAGTSIYELKKESALKTIKKKENKLEEINKILAEEISPQLEKLMKDKQNYLTWKSRENEIVRISKTVTAFDYYTLDKTVLSRSDEITQLKGLEEGYRLEINKVVLDIDGLNQKITVIESKYSNQIDKNLKELEGKHKETASELKNLKHSKENLSKNIDSNNKELSLLESKNEKLQNTIENITKQKRDASSTLDILEKELETKTNFLKELERNLEAINAGKNTTESELFNLGKLITDAKNNINKSKTEKDNLINQIKFIKDEIEKKKIALGEFKKSTGDTKKQFKELEKQINSVKDDLASLEGSYNNPQLQENLIKSLQYKENELNKIESYNNELMARYKTKFEIDFRDPENNFDRSKVKGRVLKLFALENERFSLALEQVAGGKLYSIVVDNENTSSLLLSRKCFNHGVVLIPNSKITSKRIPNDKLRRIQEVAGNDAKLAIDLIKFDNQFEPTMQYVFGSTFVCATSEIAKRLAYDNQISVRCVNLEGDVFDSNGTMSGGSNPRQQDSLLAKVQEITNVQRDLYNIKQEIGNIKNKLKSISDDANKYNDLKLKLEDLVNQQKYMDEESIKKRVKSYENEISKLEEDSKRNEDRIKELNNLEAKYTNEVKKLESEANEFKNSGKNNKEVYAKKIKGMKDTISELNKNISQFKKNINTMDYEVNKNYEEIKLNQEW